MMTMYLAVILLIYCTRSGHSNIILGPRDAEALVGTPTHFNCALSIGSAEPPHWYRYSVGAQIHQKISIYAHRQFYPLFRKRFRLENNTSGIYSLIITSVEVEDAGRYVCHDSGESRNKSSCELIVIESTPKCNHNIHPDGVIGPNSCDIEPENLELSCTVSFHGNKPPVMVWKMSGEDSSITTGLANGTLHRSVAYNLTITANLNLHGSNFSCQTTQPKTTQYSCSTDKIKVMYVFSNNSVVQKTTGDNVTCYANSSQWCNYTWKRATNETGYEEYHEQVLTSTSPGRYVCEAHCKIRDRDCTVQAMEVDLTSVQSSVLRDVHIGLGIGIPLVVMLLLFIIIMLVWKRNKKQTSKEERPLQGNQISKVIHKMKTKAASRDKKEISGMTALNEELFVITYDSRDIEVYHLKSFKRRRTLKLDGSFGDIASCCRDKRLFLMNWTAMERPNEIINVNARGKNNRTWYIHDNGGCLSITSDSNVLLSVYWKNVLIEYSPLGEEIRQISLGSGIIHPRHAIKLNTDHFVVCHGDADDQLHRVCMIDANGSITNSFGDSRGSTTSFIDSPTYLTVNKTGMVFVSEAKNKRVTILNQNFEYFRVIRPAKDQPGELKYPTRMYLDETYGRLFVADNENLANGQVTIFDWPFLNEVTVVRQ